MTWYAKVILGVALFFGAIAALIVGFSLYSLFTTPLG